MDDILYYMAQDDDNGIADTSSDQARDAFKIEFGHYPDSVIAITEEVDSMTYGHIMWENTDV